MAVSGPASQGAAENYGLVARLIGSVMDKEYIDGISELFALPKTIEIESLCLKMKLGEMWPVLWVDHRDRDTPGLFRSKYVIRRDRTGNEPVAWLESRQEIILSG